MITKPVCTCVCCGVESAVALSDWNWATGDTSRFGGVCDACLARRRRYKQLKAQAEHAAIVTAAKIGSCAWYDKIDTFMTPDEREEVRQLWHTINGGSCWFDAMVAWLAKVSV